MAEEYLIRSACCRRWLGGYPVNACCQESLIVASASLHLILPLAISLHANKGIYALLLGSGVSRAAEVPIGWEVQLDLVRRVARLRGERCDPPPAEWYEVRHGEPPNYSKLLAALAKTPAERNRLLRENFEGTEEERERGLKLERPSSDNFRPSPLVGLMLQVQQGKIVRATKKGADPSVRLRRSPRFNTHSAIRASSRCGPTR